MIHWRLQPRKGMGVQCDCAGCTGGLLIVWAMAGQIVFYKGGEAGRSGREAGRMKAELQVSTPHSASLFSTEVECFCRQWVRGGEKEGAWSLATGAAI